MQQNTNNSQSITSNDIMTKLRAKHPNSSAFRPMEETLLLKRHREEVDAKYAAQKAQPHPKQKKDRTPMGDVKTFFFRTNPGFKSSKKTPSQREEVYKASGIEPIARF